jgi:hypothetical protein
LREIVELVVGNDELDARDDVDSREKDHQHRPELRKDKELRIRKY